MSLLQYVNEEIDERRGLEYLRKTCLTPKLFRQVLIHVGIGMNIARKKHPRGELDMSCSFELVHTGLNNRRLVRVRLVTAPHRCKQLEQENFTTFLVLLDQEGSVTGVHSDSLR